MAGWPSSLLIIGCGNMGGAMLVGWLAGGLKPDRVSIVDPNLSAVPPGVRLHTKIPSVAPEAVLLGIKPQMLGDVSGQVASAISSKTVVLSLLAGVELASLAERFPQAGAVVRVMPNLSAAIGKSPIALAAQGLDDARQRAVTALMEPLGTPEWIDEDRFDLITALVGSGPAFVYRYIDALASSAAALGLDPAQAVRLACATAEGAALLAAQSDCSPGELAARVASPGGTTEAGLDILDDGAALVRLVESTLRAAAERSAELAYAVGG